MPTPDQCSNIKDAILAIRDAQHLLTQEINITSDLMKGIRLNHEYQNLDSCVSQLLHAQNVTDDAIFSQMIAAIIPQTKRLQADENTIKELLSDVATANEVVGCITKALSFIAKL